MSASVIARSLTFPATIKAVKRRFAWAASCHAGLWTTEFRKSNITWRDSASCASPFPACPPILERRETPLRLLLPLCIHRGGAESAGKKNRTVDGLK